MARYDAFISYSHAGDWRLAGDLQRALHRMARPWYRRRALHVHRDTTDLGAAPGLWSAIEEALEASRYFVLLASPEAVASPWANKEVDWWMAHREPATFLIVLTGGELVWDPKVGDFDPDASTALPAGLRGRFGEEPLWVDLRWAREEAGLSHRHLRFGDAVATLGSPLHGRSKVDLAGEDLRQQRRTRRLVGVVVATLLLLTAVAYRQRETAQDRQAEAEASEALAVDRFADLLAAEAGRAQDEGDGPEQVLQMALIALDAKETEATRTALHQALEAYPKLRRILVGHTPDWVVSSPASGIGGLFHDPDGGELLSAGFGDGRVIRWDPGTGRRRVLGLPHLLHSAGIKAVALSPDGGRLATVGINGETGWSTASWDPRSGRLLAAVTEEAGADAVAFRGDGRILTAAQAGDSLRVVARHPETLAAEDEVTLPVDRRDYGGAATIAFGADGRTIATRGCVLPAGRPGEVRQGPCTDGFVRVWDTATGRPIGEPYRPSPGAEIRSLARSPDGARLAVGMSTGRIHHWDTATGGAPEDIEGHDLQVDRLAFGPDGEHLASADAGGRAVVWDLARGEAEGPFAANTTRVTSLAFSADGRELAVGDELNVVTTWSLGTTDTQTRRSAVDDDLAGRSVAAGPDGDLVAVAGADGGVVVFDVTTPAINVVEELAVHPVDECRSLGYGDQPYHPCYLSSVRFTPDGARLVAASSEGHVFAWDTSSWQALDGPLAADAPCRSLACADRDVVATALSPDADRLAAAGRDGEIHVWDLATGEVVGVLDGAGPEVGGMAFSADGDRLAAGGADGAVHAWAVEGGEPLGPPLEGHTALVDGLAFDPTDADRLASTGHDGRVRVWDLAAGRQVVSLVNEAPQGNPGAVAFDPDGKLLATLAEGRFVGLWDTASFEPYPHLSGTGDGTPVMALGFDADGDHLVSVSASGEPTTVTVTDHRASSWRDLTCRILGHDLDAGLVATYALGDTTVCPDAPVHPSTVRRDLAAARDLADEGDGDQAVDLLAATADALVDTGSDDPELALLVCLHGITGRDTVDEVVDACELAVELAPDGPLARSARGVARALTGDTEGAIADLTAFLEAAEGPGAFAFPAEAVQRRRGWVDALESGEDPFDRSTLDAIRREWQGRPGADLRVYCPVRDGTYLRWQVREAYC